MPLDAITPATRNPKQHAVRDVIASIRRFGWTAPVILDERTEHLVAGHGRLIALRAIRDENHPAPDGVQVDGTQWLVPVVRGWESRDDAHAEAMIIADNRLTEQGGWDDRLLAEMLEEIGDYSPDLLHDTGFTEDQLHHLIAGFDGEDAKQELVDAKEKKPNPRKLELDAILTLSDPSHVGCRIAHECGIKIGTMSGKSPAPRTRERWEWRYPITFIDNEWHGYDHKKHVDFVSLFNPKYATVRDIMTKQQCEEAGVAYYTFDEVMAMAEDVQQHAENVIIIPKYDCIADIPEKYMLGYSVQSSYGSTPLPAAKFEGRRVHLLGGSWANQLRYLSILGESIVSIDFNHCLKIAMYAQYNTMDGKVKALPEDMRPSNPQTVALAISLGHIGRAIHELTNGQSGAAPEEVDTPSDEELNSDDTYREVFA